jgi:hypothetical protein
MEGKGMSDDRYTEIEIDSVEIEECEQVIQPQRNRRTGMDINEVTERAKRGRGLSTQETQALGYATQMLAGLVVDAFIEGFATDNTWDESEIKTRLDAIMRGEAG